MRTMLTWTALVLVSFVAAVAANGAEPGKDTAPTRAARIQSILDAMRAGTHSSDPEAFPNLDWDDIPVLLGRVESTAPIKTIPALHFFRGKNEPLTEGMVALYMIERIRCGPGLGVNMVPECRRSRDSADATVAEPIQRELSRLYAAWWARVRDLNPNEAAKDSPLGGSRLSWRQFGC